MGAAVTWMLALEFAVRLLLGLGLFQRDDLRLGSAPGPLGRSWLPAPAESDARRTGIPTEGGQQSDDCGQRVRAA